MSNAIADLCVLPNPAHKPNFFAGYPGLSPAFPASVVCIVYLSLLADLPAHAVTLCIKTTLRATAGANPPTPDPHASLKLPLKRRLFHRVYPLWHDGNLVSEEAMDSHGFSVRYVTPSALYTVRQDLDPSLRARLANADRVLAAHELASKPSLFPTKEYPAPTEYLARGTHLFYFDAPLPDLPPQIATAHWSIKHTLTAKVHLVARPRRGLSARAWPVNAAKAAAAVLAGTSSLTSSSASLASTTTTAAGAQNSSVHITATAPTAAARMDVPLAVPRYNDLESYLAEAPVRVRSAPDARVAYEVHMANRIIVPGSVVPVHIRLAPGEPGALPAAPSITLLLQQTVIVAAWHGTNKPTADRRWTTAVVKLTDASDVTGDWWNKVVGVPVPYTATLCPSSSSPSAKDLFPSVHVRVHLVDRVSEDLSSIAPPAVWSAASTAPSTPGIAPVFAHAPAEWDMDDPITSTTPRGSTDSAWSSVAMHHHHHHHHVHPAPPIAAAAAEGGGGGGATWTAPAAVVPDTPKSPPTTSTGSALTRGIRKAMSNLSLRSLSRGSSFSSTSSSSGPTVAAAAPAVAAAAPPPASFAAALAARRPSTSSPLRASSVPSLAGSITDLAPAAAPAAAAIPVPLGGRPSPLGMAFRASVAIPIPPPPPMTPPATDRHDSGFGEADRVAPHAPPSYKELDVPMPATYVDDVPAGADQMEIRIRHELVVLGKVGDEAIEVRIPVTVNEGTYETRSEIVRYVCA
ncbi:hypothetical protein GGF32_003408 [Allomyces javanicus]|nr:hypothetical protein GGF32_003408 [Allomyces javanicus]